MKTPECISHLIAAGISLDDATALRRIAMTLHRWHALECGDSNDYASWHIVRGRKNGGGHKSFEYLDDGKPYLERHIHSENGTRYEPIADREKGAINRLQAILVRYPGFATYVQPDPRGASLYVLRPGDVPSGADLSSVYTHGIAVYR